VRIGPFVLLIMSVSQMGLILRKVSGGGGITKGQWTKVIRQRGTGQKKQRRKQVLRLTTPELKYARGPFAQDDRLWWEIGLLLLDDAAGDAVAGVAGGVAHQIVGFGVNDERGSTVMKERVGAGVERGAGYDKAQLAFTLCIDGEIGQVAEVWFWVRCIACAVVCAGGIEVAACGGEGGAFALSNVVDVDAVIAGGELRDVDGDFYAA
jgi:hypothetical protein